MRQVTFGQESTYGTAVAVDRALEVISWGVKPNHKFNPIATLRNKSEIGKIYSGYIAEGSCKFAASYNGQGFLPYNLWGSKTTAGAGPYTHTFPATTGIGTADGVGLGLTAEVVLEENLVWRYKGGKIEGWKHSMALDQVSEIEMQMLFKTFATDATEASPTFATFAPMIPNQCYVTWAGGAEMPATSLEIEITNPRTRPRTMRAAGLYAEPRRGGVMTFKITANVIFEAFADWYSSIDGTTTGAVVLTALSSANLKWVYTMGKALITGDTPTLEGYDLPTVPLTFEGAFNTTATEGCSLVITNAEATA